MRFSVRTATTADESRIVELMSELMPGVDVVRRRAWLDVENPAGRAVTVLGFEDESGDVAGMASIFPRRIQAGGEILAGALGGDGWVRPRFRRQGLASTMHLASRFVLDTLGFELMFGTPVPANNAPLAAAGTHDIAEVVRYTHPFLVSGSPAATRLAARLGGDLATPWIEWRNAPRLEPATPLDPRVDEAWEAARAELGIATVRDASFYDWRYSRSPSGRQRPFIVMDRGRVAGACALERCGMRLRVVDLVCTASDFARVLHAIVASERNADGIEIRMTRSRARRLGMWRFGFFPRESMPLNVMRPQSCEGETRFLDGKAWHFSDADTDVDRTRRIRPERQPPAPKSAGAGSAVGSS
jgi:hypothetical protein